MTELKIKRTDTISGKTTTIDYGELLLLRNTTSPDDGKGNILYVGKADNTSVNSLSLATNGIHAQYAEKAGTADSATTSTNINHSGKMTLNSTTFSLTSPILSTPTLNSSTINNTIITTANMSGIGRLGVKTTLYFNDVESIEGTYDIGDIIFVKASS